MSTLIGIDYGHKKIGFAIGQDITKTANPLMILKNNSDLWREIDKIFNTWKPHKLVIGKPELIDGNKHPLEEKIENFIKKLEQLYSLQIFRENEAYTSEQARELSKNKKNINNIDDYAAAIILERWMTNNI